MSGSEFEQEPPQFERLQKVLARAGIGSRRVCEKLIVEQRVTVNGEFAELGEKVDPETSQVEVDGLKIGVRQDLVYYLLNKPIGVITTSKDPQERSTVVDLVPTHPRVFPVGRLDADTEGLILLTNDGDLTHYLPHQSFGIEKEHYQISKDIAKLGVIKKINALEENEIIIASGTSCRQQVLQHNNSTSMHIAEFLSDSLTVHRKK